ncbi:MAG: hypothetical protein HY692_06835 [Cyanobacteria bacterium NC_groundwater_1444_Ag_S-0.65um_54_12]|nr:hypothetical protein [Cyanobacteria bacterium NC_groundwater_1444_Ag_S-0.65um_54_12]
MFLRGAVLAGSFGSLLTLAAAAGLSGRLDRMHGAEGVARYPVPRREVIQAIATGFDNLLADSFWLQFLQYNGEKLTEDLATRRYEHLWEGLTLIIGLDPHFRDAYLFGSWVLGDAGDGKRAAELVASGARRHPTDPRYPFQLGFIEFLYRKDLPAAIQAFQHCASLAARRREDHNLWLSATRMAAGLSLRRNQRQTAIAIWRSLYQKSRELGDDRMAQIAERALERLGVNVMDIVKG